MRSRDRAKERAILDGALHVVSDVGLTGLSMDAVARAAGVAVGTVYVYFDSKEALLNTLYARGKSELARRVFRAAAPGTALKPAFLAMCTDYLGYLDGHRAELAFMRQFHGSALLTAETRRRTADTTAPLIALLERARAEGLIKDLPTPLLLTFLQGTLGELAGYAAEQPKTRRRALFAQVGQLCWDALKA